ncbi:MAG: glycoside hydrolase family 31 protein [Canidatus Methanoxibalbensis ujae]|nr:glycoside hydrolase family 31 protein [Candidatus Methanoxibalbensis ujae]
MKRLRMDRRVFVVILVAALLAALFFYQNTLHEKEKQRLLQRFSDFKQLCYEKKAQGYDVDKAEIFARAALRAFSKNNYEFADSLLDNAFEALERAEKTVMRVMGAGTNLSSVKVAVMYRRVTDGAVINRSLEDVIGILRDLNADFIFQGWMRYEPCPEHCEDLPPDKQEACELKGYSYEHLRNAVSSIKSEMPDVIFGGGQALEFLNPECWNPITGEKFGREDTWKMALDPMKWGIDISKEEFQRQWAIKMGWTSPHDRYNPEEEMPFYFPDITNPDFQDLFLSWAYKQIDCGVDAYWIDMLFRQAREMRSITGDENHTAVRESYDAASQLVHKIHQYGLSKGKYVYVMTWPEAATFSFKQPDLDAVIVTFSAEEVRSMDIDEERWDEMISDIREKMGDIPIFAIFDFGLDNSPLYVLSQEMDSEDVKDFLKMADEFLQDRGVTLIYPVHGGNMGVKQVKVLSYGKFNWYDAMAPEFQTYDVIKELALSKHG